jgi:hypothetical protein
VSFISLKDDKVPVTVTNNKGETATFWLKKIFSKKDVNDAFVEMLHEVQKYPSPKVEKDKDKEEEEDKAEPVPITLDMILKSPDGQLCIMRRAVVGWDLIYPVGHPDHPTPIEINTENIDALTEDTVKQLCDKVKELNNGLSEEDVENLNMDAGSSSPTENDSPEN